MKKSLLLAAVLAVVGHAFAQNVPSDHPKTGDLYQGVTKKVTFEKVIPPYGMEVTFDKTVHVIFPSSIRYVDLGSTQILAGKADGVENVLRVKSSKKGFVGETNFSVITEDGSFYTFNVKYADEPEKLNVEIKNVSTGNVETDKSSTTPVYLKELADESAVSVQHVVNAIYRNNTREVKHIGDKKFGIHFSLRSIYIHNGYLYLCTDLENISNLPLEIEYITLKVVDKRVLKRTAIQETVLEPIKTFNQPTFLSGQSNERTVFVLRSIAIPDDKLLVFELVEKGGGRNIKFYLNHEDLISNTKSVSKLKFK